LCLNSTKPTNYKAAAYNGVIAWESMLETFKLKPKSRNSYSPIIGLGSNFDMLWDSTYSMCLKSEGKVCCKANNKELLINEHIFKYKYIKHGVFSYNNESNDIRINIKFSWRSLGYWIVGYINGSPSFTLVGKGCFGRTLNFTVKGSLGNKFGLNTNESLALLSCWMMSRGSE